MEIQCKYKVQQRTQVGMLGMLKYGMLSITNFDPFIKFHCLYVFSYAVRTMDEWSISLFNHTVQQSNKVNNTAAILFRSDFQIPNAPNSKLSGEFTALPQTL